MFVRVIYTICRVFFSSNSLSISTTHSRYLLHNSAKACSLIFKSPLALSSFLGRLASFSALAEFLLNPIFGKLSDTYGRKTIMPLGHCSLIICRLLMFLRPYSIWPLITEQIVTVPLITSFFTTWRASLSDELEGGEFAQAAAKVGVAAGVGLVSGPLVGKFLMNRYETKWCYLASCGMAAVALYQIQHNFEETLPLDQRKELNFSDMQPLSFLQVMNKSTTLFKLMCTTGLQTMTEGRNVNNIWGVYFEKDLNWSWDEINNFIGALGVSLIVSGMTVKRMIQYFGLRMFTTFCNCCNISAWVLFSGVGPLSAISGSTRMWLGLLPGAPGGRKRDAVEALIMKHGSKADLGRGFISGSLMNFRAIVNIIAPAFFSKMYQIGVRKKSPGFVFFTGACTVLAAEMVWQSMSNVKLGLDENGREIKHEVQAESADGNIDDAVSTQ